MPYDPYSGGFGGSDPYGFGSIFSSLGGLLNGFGSLFPQLQQQQFQQNPFLGGAQGLANSLYQPQTYPDYSSFQPSFNSSMPTGFDTSSYLTQPSSDLAGLMQNLYGQANQGIPTGQQSQPFSNAVLPNLPNVQEIYRPPAGSGTTNLNFTQNANPTITANPTNTFSPTNTNTNTANGGAGGSGGSGSGGYDPYSNPYSAISQADRGVTLPGYTGGNSLGTQVGQPVLPGAGGLGDALGGQGTYGGGSPLSLSDLLGSFGSSNNPFSSGGSIPFSGQPSFTGNNPFGSQATFGGGTPFNSSLGFDPTGGSYTLPANPNSFGGYNPLGTGLYGGGGGGSFNPTGGLSAPNPFSAGPSMYEPVGGSMWNTLPYNLGQMPMGQSPFGPSSPFAQAPSYPQQMYQQPQYAPPQPQYSQQQNYGVGQQNYGVGQQNYMGAPSGYQPQYAQPQSYGQPAYQPPPPNGSIYSYNQWGQPSVNQPAIGGQPGFSVPGPSYAGWATDPQYQYQQPSYAPQMAYQQQQQQQADQQPFFGQQYAQGQQQGLVGILNRFGQYQQPQQAPQTPPPSLPTAPPASRGGHPMYPLPRQQPPQQVDGSPQQGGTNTDSQAANGSPSRRGYGSVNGAPVRQGDQYTPAQQSGERNSGYAATGAQGPTGSWNPPEIANASTPSQGTPYQPPENNTPWAWQTNGTSANMVNNPGPPPQPTTPQNTQGMNSYAGNSWRPPSGQSGYGNTLGTSLPQAGSSRPPPTNGPPSVSNGPLGFRPNTKPMNRPPSTTQGNPQTSFIGLGSTAPSPIGPQSPQGSGTMPSLIGGGSQGFQGGQGGMYSSTGAPGSFHPWSGGAPPGYSIQNVPGNLYGSMGAGQQTPANTVTHPGGGKQLAPGAGQPVRRAGLAGMMPRPQ